MIIITTTTTTTTIIIGVIYNEHNHITFYALCAS